MEAATLGEVPALTNRLERDDRPLGRPLHLGAHEQRERVLARAAVALGDLERPPQMVEAADISQEAPRHAPVAERPDSSHPTSSLVASSSARSHQSIASVNDPATIRADATDAKHVGEGFERTGGSELEDRHRLGETLAALGEAAALHRDVRELVDRHLHPRGLDLAERRDRLSVAAFGLLVAAGVLYRLRLEVERRSARSGWSRAAGRGPGRNSRPRADVEGHRVAPPSSGPCAWTPERVDRLAAAARLARAPDRSGGRAAPRGRRAARRPSARSTPRPRRACRPGQRGICRRPRRSDQAVRERVLRVSWIDETRAGRTKLRCASGWSPMRTLSGTGRAHAARLRARTPADHRRVLHERFLSGAEVSSRAAMMACRLSAALRRQGRGLVRPAVRVVRQLPRELLAEHGLLPDRSAIRSRTSDRSGAAGRAPGDGGSPRRSGGRARRSPSCASPAPPRVAFSISGLAATHDQHRETRRPLEHVLDGARPSRDAPQWRSSIAITERAARRVASRKRRDALNDSICSTGSGCGRPGDERGESGPATLVLGRGPDEPLDAGGQLGRAVRRRRTRGCPPAPSRSAERPVGDALPVGEAAPCRHVDQLRLIVRCGRAHRHPALPTPGSPSSSDELHGCSRAARRGALLQELELVLAAHERGRRPGVGPRCRTGSAPPSRPEKGSALAFPFTCTGSSGCSRTGPREPVRALADQVDRLRSELPLQPRRRVHDVPDRDALLGRLGADRDDSHAGLIRSARPAGGRGSSR